MLIALIYIVPIKDLIHFSFLVHKSGIVPSVWGNLKSETRIVRNVAQARQSSTHQQSLLWEAGAGRWQFRGNPFQPTTKCNMLLEFCLEKKVLLVLNDNVCGISGKIKLSFGCEQGEHNKMI